MATKYETLDHQRIVEMYKEKSLRDIAKEFGVSGVLISKVLRNYNVPRRSVGGMFNKKPGMHTDAKLKATVNRLYWEEELTTAECGQRLGISGCYVSKLMRGWGIPARKGTHKNYKKMKSLNADAIVEMYVEKHQTMAFIARHFDVTPPTIRKVLIAQGVPRRTHAEQIVLTEKRRNADKSPKTVLVVPDVPDTSIADQILMMREQQNAKVQDIAAVLDVSTVDVFDVIRAAGAL